MHTLLAFCTVLSSLTIFVKAVPMDHTESSDGISFYSTKNMDASAEASESATIIDNFADVAQYLPPNQYRPKDRRVNESLTHYSNRLAQGEKKFAYKRRQLAEVIRWAIHYNRNPENLQTEIDLAVHRHKERMNERDRVTGAMLRDLGLRRHEFEAIPKNNRHRQDLLQDGKKKRNWGYKVRRYYRWYHAASESEKPRILHDALSRGVSYEEVTGQKPPVAAVDADNVVIIDDDEDDDEDDGGVDLDLSIALKGYQ